MLSIAFYNFHILRKVSGVDANKIAQGFAGKEGLSTLEFPMSYSL